MKKMRSFFLQAVLDGLEDEITKVLSDGHISSECVSRGIKVAAKARHRTVVSQLVEWLKQNPNPSSSSSTSAHSTTTTTPPHKGPQHEDECVICLTPDSQLNRPMFLVFDKCGHKCLCKPCSRKLKNMYKSNEPECPLCRKQSRLVHTDLYKGTVFGSSARK